MIPGIVAEEGFGHKHDVPTWANEIFECKFNGPNLTTSATDESPIHASITFHNDAIISSDFDAVFSGSYQFFPGSLRTTTTDGYVEMPPNAAYDTLGDGDFTLMWSSQEYPVKITNVPVQWVGVWDLNNVANQSWRFFTDSERLWLQYHQGGQLKSVGLRDFYFPTPEWMWTIVWRYKDNLTVATGNQAGNFSGGMLDAPCPGKFDPPATPTPMRIHGPTITTASPLPAIRYSHLWMITKGALWHSHEIDQKLDFLLDGSASAEVIPVSKWFYHGPSVTPPRYSDVPDSSFPNMLDSFYPPTVSMQVASTQTLHPALVSLFTVFPSDYPGSFGLHESSVTRYPTHPLVLGGHNNDIQFVNAQYSSGRGSSATLTLPSGRAPGNWMIAILQTRVTLQTFQNMDNSNGWLQISQNSIIFPKTGDMIWASTDAADISILAPPTFVFDKISSWHGVVVQFSGSYQIPIVDTNALVGSGSLIGKVASEANIFPEFFVSNLSAFSSPPGDNFPASIDFCVVMTKNNIVIPSLQPSPWFVTVSQVSSNTGSVLIAVRSPANGTLGSGNVYTIVSDPTTAWGMLLSNIQALPLA